MIPNPKNNPEATPDELKSQEAPKATGTVIGGTPAVQVSSARGSELKLEEMTEAELMANPIIEALPLGFGSALDIKIKRNEYAYRWVNRLAQEGGNYTKALSIGYSNATEEDIEVVDKNTLRDKTIIVGDLILMKMPKLKYIAALKHNMQKANIVSSKKGLEKLGKDEGARAVSSISAPKEYEIHKKVSFYQPPIGEL